MEKGDREGEGDGDGEGDRDGDGDGDCGWDVYVDGGEGDNWRKMEI